MDLAVAPAHLVDPARRDQDPLPGPPVAGIDDQVADRPIRVVDQERLDMADVLVGGVDVVAGDVPGALQMRVARSLERVGIDLVAGRSEEHTSELQSLMRISYAVFCLKKKKNSWTISS